MVDLGASAERRQVTVVRVTPKGRAARDLSTEADYGGRGHAAGAPAPMYSSEDEATAEAEFLHHHPYFTGAQARFTTLTGTLLVLDITDPAACEQCGADLDELLQDDPGACQRFCSNAFMQGVEAVRLPSVREHGRINLIVHRAAALASLRESEVAIRVLGNEGP